MSKVIWKKCMTLSFKINRQVTCLFSTFLISSISKMLESTLRSTMYHVCNRIEIWKIMQKCVWPRFSRSNIKVRWLILGFLRCSTLKMLESSPRSSLHHVYSWSWRSYNDCVWPWVPRSTVKVTGLFLTFLISLTSKMLELTPRSTLYHVCNRRYERSCKKVFDLDLQGHAMKIEFFHYHRWIPWLRKHTHEKYFRKNRTGRPKSRGVVSLPLGVFGWRNTLGK